MFVFNKTFYFSNKNETILSCLVTNPHRHSLYEPPTQSPPKLKRTQTIHSLYSSGTNNTASKASPPAERRQFREGKCISDD